MSIWADLKWPDLYLYLGGSDIGMRKKPYLWLLAVAASAAVMALIVYFSSQPSSESSELSKHIAGEILGLFQTVFPGITPEDLHHLLRKLAHFTLYFILGCSLTGVFGMQRRVPPVLAVILAGAAFAIADELHQTFSEGRNASIYDVLLDTCGAATGSFLTNLIVKACRSKA